MKSNDILPDILKAFSKAYMQKRHVYMNTCEHMGLKTKV